MDSLGSRCWFVLGSMLLVCCALTRVVDAANCTEGLGLCTGVANNVTTGNYTWCCPTPADMVPSINYYSANNQTCVCITGAQNQAQLQAKIVAWATNTSDWGRMCNEGDSCRGSKSNTTINDKYIFCCRNVYDIFKVNSSQYTAIFDGHDAQYIGCRCEGNPVPKNPFIRDGYLLPATGRFNSTGENCSYNLMCHDFPRLKCSDPATNTTLCCYGSRGMDISTEGGVTKCTCTNEKYMTQCPANIGYIPGEEPGKVQECSKAGQCFLYDKGVVPANVKVTDPGYHCCLQYNFTRLQVELTDGSVACICKEDLTIQAKIVAWADSTKDKGRMCTRGPENCEGARGRSWTNSRKELTQCCWKENFNSSVNIYESAIIFDADKLDFIGCRCANYPLPVPAAGSYVVPPANTMFNSTGENCSFDEACKDHPSEVCNSTEAVFCCYGSRGVVTTNTQDQANQYTGCTCTNEIFGAQCTAQPIAIKASKHACLKTNCSIVTNNTNVCSYQNSPHNADCCPSNMVVVADGKQCECRIREQYCLTDGSVVHHASVSIIAVAVLSVSLTWIT